MSDPTPPPPHDPTTPYLPPGQGVPPSGQWPQPGQTPPPGAWGQPGFTPPGQGAPPPGQWAAPPPAHGVPPSGQWAPAPAPGQGGPPGPPGQWPPPGPPTGEPLAAPRRSRRGLVAAGIAVLGVLALVAVGAYALRAVRGESGGSDSPEQAVRDLAAAVDSEDAVAMAAVLDPSEVRALGELFEEVEAQAAEAGFAGSDQPLVGLDLAVEDLELEVEELGDDVARVTLTDGTASYRLEESELAENTRGLLPDDVETSDSIDVDDVVDEMEEEADGPDELYLMTVRRDGGWYVSLAFTAASYTAEALDLPDGDFDDVEALGDAADDPEAAVRELVEAGATLDPETIREELPEDEWSVAGAYERALTEIIEGDGDELDGVSISDVEIDIDEADLEVEEINGSTQRVVIAGSEGTVRWTEDDDGSDHSAEWTSDGWCLEVLEEGEDEDDGGLECPWEDDSLADQIIQVESPYVVTVEERGGWVVSPTATVVDMARQVVPQLTPDVIHSLIGRPDLIEPSGTVALGEPVEVEVGPAGASTLVLAPEQDTSVVVSAEEVDDDSFVDVDVFDADGEYVLGDFSSPTELVGGEEYRVVVEGPIGGQATVTVSEISVEPLPAGALQDGLAGELTATTPVRIYTFSPAEDVTVEMTLDGDEGVVAEIEGGSEFCTAEAGFDGELCTLSADDDYELTISSYFDDIGEGAEYTIDFTAAGTGTGSGSGEATIDGGTFVSATIVEGGTNIHDVSVPAGETASFLLEAVDGSTDIDVDWGEDGSYSSGSDEVFEIEGPFEGELEVFIYSGADEADYTIQLDG